MGLLNVVKVELFCEHQFAERQLSHFKCGSFSFLIHQI
jgi:hypothetical protein